MSVTIDIYGYDGSEYSVLSATSGIGFYGAGFGNSVSVDSYGDSLYLTDANGIVQGPSLCSIKYVHSSSGLVSQSSNTLDLTDIPNFNGINARLTSDTAVQVQTVKLYIYDRSSLSNPPSGVTVKCAELIHPDSVEGASGSGDATWNTPSGSSYMSLANSPGLSGLYAGDGSSSEREDTRHDWYFAISASPQSVGSKTLVGLYLSAEYI